MGRGEPLLVTATWQDGVATLYLNGKRLAQETTDDSAPVELRLGDLRFGEDYPPTSLTNEPFLGLADDILVLKRALSAEDVAKLAADGPQSVTNEQDEGLLYQADGPTPRTLVDALGHDGDLMLPNGAVTWGDTQLLLNVSTSVAGSVRCELQTPDGTPIPGFTLVYGDGIELPVSWRGGQTELKELAGRPLRLKLELKDADLYAIRFGQPAKE
jgi:hypothetical protein